MKTVPSCSPRRLAWRVVAAVAAVAAVVSIAVYALTGTLLSMTAGRVSFAALLACALPCTIPLIVARLVARRRTPILTDK